MLRCGMLDPAQGGNPEDPSERFPQMSHLHLQNGLLHDPLSERIDLFLAGIGQGFNAYPDRAARSRRISALSRRSDADLARMGLSRDRIVAHVYSDLLGE